MSRQEEIEKRVDMTKRNELREILEKTIMNSGRSYPKEGLAMLFYNRDITNFLNQAEDAIRKWAIGKLPEKKNTKGIVYIGGICVDAHFNLAIDEARKNLEEI